MSDANGDYPGSVNRRPSASQGTPIRARSERHFRPWLVSVLAVALLAASGLLAVTIIRPWRVPRFADGRPLFTRTTTSQVHLAVEEGTTWFPSHFCPDGQPGDCTVSAPGLSVLATGPDGSQRTAFMIDSGSQPTDARLRWTGGMTPAGAGAQSAAVFGARVDPTITEVRVRLNDGSWDSMTPQDGWVVFTDAVRPEVPGKIESNYPGPVEALNASGHIVVRCRIASNPCESASV